MGRLTSLAVLAVVALSSCFNQIVLASAEENGAGLKHTSALSVAATPDSSDDQSTLIWQAVEQNMPMSAVYDQRLMAESAGADIPNDTYLGLKRFWDDEIVGNLFPNVGQLFGKWLAEWLDGWAADTVGLLTAMLRTFFLNPNIAAHAQGNVTESQNSDDISPMIRQAASVMYAIALDLLLFLFILAIWRYWTEAAWRGGLSVMGAVARLIFTCGILLAWPTICALEIEISNQMIKAIFFGVSDQVQMLDATLASTVRAGLVAAAYLVAKSILPTLGAWSTSIVGSTIGGAVSTVALVIFLILTVVLIVQLVVVLVMKAVQTVLLTAQYMFSPVFLIFFATPDTESVASGFIKSCVEVSLWTFVWVGLLKIMVILLFSAVSPWGKILMAIAILQIMIQVPSFLARASISPISPFAASGLISAGLKTAIIKLGSTIFEKSLSLAAAVSRDQGRGSVERLTTGRADCACMLEKLRPPEFSNPVDERQPHIGSQRLPVRRASPPAQLGQRISLPPAAAGLAVPRAKPHSAAALTVASGKAERSIESDETASKLERSSQHFAWPSSNAAFRFQPGYSEERVGAASAARRGRLKPPLPEPCASSQTSPSLVAARDGSPSTTEQSQHVPVEQQGDGVKTEVTYRSNPKTIARSTYSEDTITTSKRSSYLQSEEGAVAFPPDQQRLEPKRTQNNHGNAVEQRATIGLNSEMAVNSAAHAYRSEAVAKSDCKAQDELFKPVPRIGQPAENGRVINRDSGDATRADGRLEQDVNTSCQPPLAANTADYLNNKERSSQALSKLPAARPSPDSKATRPEPSINKVSEKSDPSPYSQPALERSDRTIRETAPSQAKPPGKRRCSSPACQPCGNLRELLPAPKPEAVSNCQEHVPYAQAFTGFDTPEPKT